MIQLKSLGVKNRLFLEKMTHHDILQHKNPKFKSKVADQNPKIVQHYSVHLNA
jgi:hypothetical protein